MSSRQIYSNECIYIITIEELENLISRYKNKNYTANLQLKFVNGLSVMDKIVLPDEQTIANQHCSLCNNIIEYAIINTSVANDTWRWACEDHFDYFYDNSNADPVIILSTEKFEIHNVD